MRESDQQAARGVAIHPAVEAALRAGHPVVALESAVITHGLPSSPLGRRPRLADAAWNAHGPINLELARLLERTVRAHGAEPATCAVLDGWLRIGMTDADLSRLAGDPSTAVTGPSKAAARDIASCVALGTSAGLTVSGTLAACRIASAAVAGAGAARRLCVLATGGIGGAHRGWSSSGDISSDLVQLSRTDVCVVCSGAKSILDVAATMELLDSLAVPVIGRGVEHMPRFVCPPDPALPLPSRLDDATAIAHLCTTRWGTLGQQGGVLVVQEVPPELAIPADRFEALLRLAEERARTSGVRGPAVTPFLLSALTSLSDGATLDANVALLMQNARTAAEVAVALAGEPR